MLTSTARIFNCDVFDYHREPILFFLIEDSPDNAYMDMYTCVPLLKEFSWLNIHSQHPERSTLIS